MRLNMFEKCHSQLSSFYTSTFIHACIFFVKIFLQKIFTEGFMFLLLFLCGLDIIRINFLISPLIVVKDKSKKGDDSRLRKIISNYILCESKASSLLIFIDITLSFLLVEKRFYIHGFLDSMIL